MNKILRYLLLTLPMLLQEPTAALAQQTAKAAIALAEIAQLDGPNRSLRLVEGAKREGEVTVYTTLSNDDLAPISDLFIKRYGVKLKIWRSNSGNILRRIIADGNAGRSEIDVVLNLATDMEALHHEKLLQAVKSPEHAYLMPSAIPSHREWVANTIMVLVQGYNPKIVKKEELPKSYQDLLDPRWKGRLGIDADDKEWFATLSQELGEEKTHKLFENIVATNGVSVRKGHTLLANLVAVGEVPLALTVYSYRVELLKQKGSPIEWFTIPPVIAQWNGIGIMKMAPHPHAAMLLYDFMLSEEGQRLVATHYYLPTNNKVEWTTMKDVPLTFIDPAQAIDLQGKWSKAYEDYVTKRTGR